MKGIFPDIEDEKMAHHEQPSENRRIGVVAVIVHEPEKAYDALNKILHDYSNIIIGRLGLRR
mgnify:CR=1 FL=1